MFRKRVFCFIVLLLVTGLLYSQPLHSSYMSVAAMGMGGSFTAYPRDATATMVNPALLNRTGFHLTLFSFPFSIDDEATDIVNFLNNHQDDFSHFDLLTTEESDVLMRDIAVVDDRWLYTDVNPFFGLTIPASQLGAAVYSNISPGVKVDQGVVLPAAGLKGSVDIGIAVGKGFEFMDYEAGLALRFYRRGTFDRVRISAAKANSANETLSAAWQNTKDNLQTGFGLDAGVIRSINEKLDVAVTVRDLIGSRDGWIKPNLITGVGYKLTDRILLCADMNDWFNSQGVALFQKLNMGANSDGICLTCEQGFTRGILLLVSGLTFTFLNLVTLISAGRTGISPVR